MIGPQRYTILRDREQRLTDWALEQEAMLEELCNGDDTEPEAGH